MKKHLALEHLDKNEPLYHYTKCYAVQNIFRTGILFATKSSFLNDTNEMDYILHVAAEVIAEFPEKRWRQLFMNEIVGTMEDFKRHDIFVVSFSEERDSITLWSEFGDETGYNLQFDGTELLERISEHQKIYCHGRVLYSHQKQMALIKNLFCKLIPKKIGLSFEEIMSRELLAEDQGEEPGSTKEFQDMCRRLRTALNIYAMFFKQEEFQAEKEYRVVFKNPDKNKIRFRVKDGFLLPYIDVVLAKNALLPVKKITVAPKNHVDLARRGMLQYTQMLGYDIPVELSNLKLRY